MSNRENYKRLSLKKLLDFIGLRYRNKLTNLQILKKNRCKAQLIKPNNVFLRK